MSESLCNLAYILSIDQTKRPEKWLSMKPKLFIPYLSADHRVFFYNKTSHFKDEHFIRLIKDAKTLQSTPNSLVKTDWDGIETRLKRPYNNTTTNSDVRTFYTLGDNVFLVTKSFTFGVFCVEQGEKHIYTTNSPLLIYSLIEPNRTLNDASESPTLTRRTFKAQDWRYYESHVMRPGEMYYVPQNTHYFIVSLKKTLFVVHRVSANLEIDNCQIFTTHDTCIDPFTVPPPTPRGPGSAPALILPKDRLKLTKAKREPHFKKPKRWVVPDNDDDDESGVPKKPRRCVVPYDASFVPPPAFASKWHWLSGETAFFSLKRYRVYMVSRCQ